MRLTGTVLILLGLTSFAFGGTTYAPEIDPAAGVGALTLLSGALLVIRARKRQ